MSTAKPSVEIQTTDGVILSTDSSDLIKLVFSTNLEKDLPANQVTKSSKDTTMSSKDTTKRKQIKRNLRDVTGSKASSMIWKPFYRDLTEEEFNVVCKNYSGTKHVDLDGCYVCAIHPSCTHVIKKYK
jgi:hypothetical protein